MPATNNTGFAVRRASVLRMKVLSIFEHWFFASTFVLKIPPAKLRTVSGKRTQTQLIQRINMKTKTKLKLTFLLTTFLFVGCEQNNNKKSDNSFIDNSYIKELVERQIGESNYYISIPKDYTLEATDGPDFSVYYFYPIDTTIIANFSGGFYFGNHPSQFPPDSGSCKINNSKSKILDENADWTIYNCNDEYAIQTIIDSKSGEGWNEFIHAFGRASSTADRNKLLTIFTTMKKK